jgi:uncharacterized iron-regulated protein
MKYLTGLITFLFFVQGFSQNADAFKIFNAKGKKISYRKLLKKAAKADVVFFGEEHNNTLAHWLELKITKDLYKLKNGKIILGAEMFERDNQKPLSEYVEGKIDEKKLDSLARLWPNFKKDYKPLTDFARKKKLKFIATNIPRRYASLVYKKGFKALDTLGNKEKKWIAPLPVAYDSTLSQYAKMNEMMRKHGHNNPNLPKAQAIKDATMAYSIASNIKPGYTFIHFNGSYHSAFHQGIIWYLRRQKPDIKILTLEVVSQKNIEKPDPEILNTADFIILTDDSFPKSY